MKRTCSLTLAAVLDIPLVIAMMSLSGCGYVQPGGTGVAANGNPQNYYVAPVGDDASDGSAGNPWRTISHAEIGRASCRERVERPRDKRSCTRKRKPSTKSK